MSNTQPPSADGENQKSTRPLALAAVTVSLLFAFVMAEIFVRLLFPYNSPDTIRQHSLEYLPAVYTRTLLKPLGRIVDVHNDKAWGADASDTPSEKLYYISANGYRGPEFDVHNKADKTRVVVLGGSSVFDQHVWDTQEEISNTWPHQIGQHLQQQGFADIEVINAGIPGHTSSDSLGRLLSQLWTYDPDYVLVYHGWNDIKLWHRSPISPEDPLTTHVPPFLEHSNPFMSYQGTFDRILTSSQVFMKLRNRYYKWRINVGAEGTKSQSEAQGIADSYGPFGPRQFQLNLEQIVSASRSIGATPVLISQATLAAPDNTEADLNEINFSYQLLTHDALIDAYNESYDIIREVGARTGTSVIDAAGPMSGKREYFVDHVHTTPAGSARLAQIVATDMAAILSAPEE